jgi:uncharacterized DUF497 family protein
MALKLEWDLEKEQRNLAKHGLDFSIAEFVVRDPLSIIVEDRFENGEHRHHWIGVVGSKCFVLVHAYPDPTDDMWIRVISLRQATPAERKRYEEGGYD